jgi:predicted transcriptional regulator
MAVVAIADATKVRRVAASQDEVYTGIAGATITQGQVVYADATDGDLKLADGSAAGTATALGIALEGAAEGQALGYLKKGKIAGFTISGLDYGAWVYLSDTAGALDTAAGTVSLVCGRVMPSSDDTPQKQLYIDLNYAIPGV